MARRFPPLTERQKSRLAKAYKNGASVTELAEKFPASRKKVIQAIHDAGMKLTTNEKKPPTPEEILSRKAEVQATWSVAEEQKRRCGGLTEYMIPTTTVLTTRGKYMGVI